MPAARLNIRSIPEVLRLKDGQMVDAEIGADPRPRSLLDARIARHAV